jgi:hypothetical protein
MEPMKALTIILLLIAILANAEMDRIKIGKGLIKGKYWNENLWQDRNWFIKYPLSFLLDGWHLCKSIMVFSFSLIIALLIDNALYSLIIYTVYGMFFNLIYHRT